MSDHGQSCSGNHATPPSEEDWLSGPVINPLQLSGNEHVADMIDSVFARSGFNARRLAEACRLYRRMIEQEATIGMTLAGAMTPIGMSGVIISLMEAGFIDWIISTGANLYHDLHRAYDMPMVQGAPEVDDNELADLGVARIYDVFIHDSDTLEATDKVILKAIKGIDLDRPLSTARLHDHIGRRIVESAPHPERSMVARASQLGVPMYTSSPGDSSIGMNLVVPHMFHKELPLNPLLDVIETTAIVRGADKNGVIEVGGGSPKNFYLQTQPTLHQILHDPSKGGHDFVIQLTVDSPHWGGLSGATPSEARSWGKIKDATRNNVVVYSCASLTLPLLAQYALTRCKPRRQRRLYEQIGQLTQELREATVANPDFAETYDSLYRID